MSKQKSMGQVVYEASINSVSGPLWVNLTEWPIEYRRDLSKAIISEHERRKRATCSDCQHVGSGSCKSCRYWLAKHAPSYFERKRAKSKKDKK